MRCFLALEIPSEVKARLGELSARLRPFAKGVRWVEPGQIHLTLHFFGDISEERLPVLETVVAPLCAAAPPFRLSVQGAGSFGPRGTTRVLWAGIGGDVEVLQSFRSALERDLSAAGFSCEERPFSPHLTLGRAHEPKRNLTLQDELGRESTFHAGTFEGDHLALFSSTLTPGGAIYKSLATWKFGG